MVPSFSEVGVSTSRILRAGRDRVRPLDVQRGLGRPGRPVVGRTVRRHPAGWLDHPERRGRGQPELAVEAGQVSRDRRGAEGVDDDDGLPVPGDAAGRSGPVLYAVRICVRGQAARRTARRLDADVREDAHRTGVRGPRWRGRDADGQGGKRARARAGGRAADPRCRAPGRAPVIEACPHAGYRPSASSDGPYRARPVYSTRRSAALGHDRTACRTPSISCSGTSSTRM